MSFNFLSLLLRVYENFSKQQSDRLCNYRDYGNFCYNILFSWLPPQYPTSFRRRILGEVHSLIVETINPFSNYNREPISISKYQPYLLTFNKCFQNFETCFHSDCGMAKTYVLKSTNTALGIGNSSPLTRLLKRGHKYNSSGPRPFNLKYK